MAEKKMPTEMTVEEKLKKLYELQKVLSRIDEIRTIRGELPLEVQDLEDEIEGLSIRIAKKKEEVAALHLSLNKWNEEKLQFQANIERHNEKLNAVSNSREYDNLSKEIEFQNLEIELREKRIRDNAPKETEMNEMIARYVEEKIELIQELEVKRAELDEIISENKAEEDRLREESKMLEEKIEPRLLMAFKRIRKGSHNGLGVVVVERDSCGGCFAKIAPQRQLDVMFHKKIIVCEYCGRILVDPELAGIKQEKQVEVEKKTRRRAAKKSE